MIRAIADRAMDHGFSGYDRPRLGDSVQSSNRPTTTLAGELRPDHEYQSSSLDLLSTYRTSYNRLNAERLDRLIIKERRPSCDVRELSAEEIVRVAAARFIRLSTRADDDGADLYVDEPPISVEDMRGVDLASRLLAAGESVSRQQYDRARELLRQCYGSASSTGNPVQRVVCYFSEALQLRIDRETGRLSSKRPRGDEKGPGLSANDVIKVMRSDHPLQLVTQEKLPFPQLSQFLMIQTIIDNVGSARRIHMIDVSIKHGLQWTVLMQALATRHECPIDYLKITALGNSEEAISTTGKRLKSFAETLGIAFGFRSVIVKDMRNLREDMFDVREGETVGVYSSLDMNTMILGSEGLENLIRILRRLRPCIMVVTDVEAKHNSPCFINRFTEALFYYSALFDHLNGFMDAGDITRLVLEERILSQGIASIITTEGRDRVVRHVGISVWRSFFARFGLVEAQLSDWSQYQASVLVKQFANGSSCTLEENGKALMVGWKGTPLIFISAWKFFVKAS